MLKVSFKKDKKFPIKKVQRNGLTRETIVTLKGEAILPELLQYYIPPKIWDWIDTCKNVQAGFSMTKMHLTIKGKAKRAESDADNPVLGERIAEARAKINLYKFMWKLADELIEYCCILMGKYIQLKEEYGDTLVGASHKYSKLFFKEKEHLRTLIHELDTENPSKP